ncbi:MAG: UvrD-helicase domain-containing protein [Alphaproteobacteria bacterium]|nr:UvrD-helicase domain-containing protein [Alphaproteobacteria bacterium]
MTSDPFEDPLDEAAAAMAAPVAEPRYLTNLNESQKEAVLAIDGPVLVLAGAGTGKTRVLTTRLAHILATRRAWPGQIMAVTFTNKAAREMKERIGALIGGVVEGMQWLGTFHSIAAKILRRHAELVGLKSNFTILDDDDQLRILKQIIEAANIDEKRWPARGLLSLIDRWKNRAQLPEQVPAGESHAYANGKGAALYAQYQERLRQLNATDFGDLLLHNIRIFKEHEEILADYHRRFLYILVDEYQDTNVAQYLWLRLLASERRNICCVGDDDQAIYGWRGAEVDNILRFERDFPGARVIRLELNYRSTPHILGAASGLIAANQGRLGKTLWTPLNEGEKVQVKGYWDGEEEARAIGEEIEAVQRAGSALSDIAVLVRASFQMRAFEERFLNLGLPYRVVGGPRFYERQEIRDALAYFRIVVQPDDDLAFERIVNRPKRGFGETSQQALHKTARRMGVPLLRAARYLSETEELPGKARNALQTLVAAIDRWAQAKDGLPHTELAGIVLEESGYIEMWQLDKSPEAPGRLDNLKELVRSMEEFENLQGFLEHVALVMDMEQRDTADRVTLMTLHAAKGLEFGTVFLPGWEDGLFPHQRSLDENGTAGLEEERRLAYVGLTRARRSARVSFAANRRTYGQWMSSIPSRFIAELPKEHIEVAEMESHYGYAADSHPSRWDNAAFGSTYSSPGWQRARSAVERGMVKTRGPLIEGHAELIATSTPGASPFARGDRVQHDRFGRGRVTHVEGNKLTVEFDSGGEKRVIANFLKPA